MANSRQGFNIAFIGTTQAGQTACAEYLYHTYRFKRINMDEALRQFIKTSYWYKVKQNTNWIQKLQFYDAIYSVDNEIFIKYMRGRMEKVESDVVVWDVRYLNEMKALKDMGFIICQVYHPRGKVEIGKYVKSSNEGTVAVAMTYDDRFSINHSPDISVTWGKYSDTKPIMDALLTRIGYKI